MGWLPVESCGANSHCVPTGMTPRHRLCRVDAGVVTGLFTLGGVVAGGALTGAIEGRRDSRRSQAEARAAARLVQDEARGNHAAITLVQDMKAEHDQFEDLRDSIQRGYIANAMWSEHRGVLARELGDDEWEAVQDAYLGVRLVLSVRAEDKLGLSFKDARSNMAGVLSDVEQQLAKGITALRKRAFPARAES